MLRNFLDALRDDIRSGVPVVGFEPSCVATFRDELRNLLPHNQDSRRLSRQVFTLGEFLLERTDNFHPPQLEAEALLHGHCNHKSIMGIDCETELIRRMGVDLSVLDSGCCGMAGSFGFEKEKYDVSVACGERVLLPAVRAAKNSTLVVADGFSCREQIEQLAGREALHTAQLLSLAYDQSA